jgi:hypothetical protein
MRAHKLLTGLIMASTVAATAALAAPAAAKGRPGSHGPGQHAAPAAAATARALGSGPLRPPTAPGIVTGLVRGPGGAPLARVCVTASSPAGHALAMTSSDGRYVLSGLRTGRYSLQYRGCTDHARYVPRQSASTAVASGVSLPRGAELPSDAGLPGQSSVPGAGRLIMIAGGSVTRLAPVTLRPAGSAGGIRPTTPRRLSLAELRRRASRVRSGSMSGHVTDAAGHPLAGFCVWVQYRGFAVGSSTKKDGSYHVGPFLPPGHVTVLFTASCLDGPGASTGNWAPEWYKGRFSQAKADEVTIRSGHVTKGINVVMRHGGQIAGVVKNGSGGALAGVCVDVLSNNGARFITQVKTVGGRYRADSLDPGRYRVLFDPACGYHRTPYLLQWWRDAAGLKGSAPVKVRLAAVTSHIDATLALGAKISGVVRFKNRSGLPLRGMCVDAIGTSGATSSVDGFSTTGRRGRYVIEGLPGGSYSLLVGPGCRSNANVLHQRYPHPVTVSAGKAKVINFYLQPGGILSGTVTSAADGTPLGGICVGIGRLGDFAITASDGSYTLDQIPTGRYAIGFFGGCGNPGSYAPQWFSGRDHLYRAAGVLITQGKVTAGIDAAMRPGATISGTVVNSSGHKVTDACVGALDPGTAVEFGPLGDTLSRAGTYRIANLAAGQYQVGFFWCGSGPGYTPQWFRSRPGSTRKAALLDVARGATVTGVDAVLRRAGGITGTITDTAGNPVGFACVSAINEKPGGVSSLYDFGGGGYFIGGLPPGRYDVQFVDCGGFGFATQWYSGKTTQRAANAVTVTAGHVTKSIDAVLTTKAGSISGRVTAKATGRPVAGIAVEVYNHSSYGLAFTSRTGDYVVTGLNSGSYRVFVFSFRGGPYATMTRPGSVHVVAPKAVTGINVALVPAGLIAGTVLSGSPVPVGQPAVCVAAFAAGGGFPAGGAETGHGGHYAIGNLAAGTYKVLFGYRACAGGAEGLVPQWYQGKRTRASATTIVVRQGQVSAGLNATLARDGTISGTVTGPAPASAPLAGICVIARPLNKTSPVYAVSSPSGYTLTGVPPGRYLVEFKSGCGTAGFATQWWHDAGSRAGATVLVIAAGQTTSGIDATMSP